MDLKSIEERNPVIEVDHFNDLEEKLYLNKITNQHQTKANAMTDAERAKDRKENIHIAITLGVIIFSVLFIFHFVLMNGRVMSGSMEPTLMTGQYFIANRLAYVKGTPKRGDIISFKNKDKTLIKRVIGIAGDQIEFHDGYVYLNGEKLDESKYLDPDVKTYCAESFLVPKGSVFVLGDNREYSADSRDPEEISGNYVPIKNIKAKMLFSIPML